MNENYQIPLSLNKTHQRRILCIVIVYFDYNIIKSCLNFLCLYNDQFDIIVVENRSKYTESHIQPYILKLVDSTNIMKYYLFNKNISNNALEILFDDGQVDLSPYDYVMLTDGDLIVEDKQWLSEQLSILADNQEIFACGIKLDMANLPTHTFPDAVTWIPTVIAENNTYDEVLTGVNLLMLRREGLIGFLNYRKINGLKILDGHLHDYCYQILKMKWARTKRSAAIHLTWDNYHDLKNEYTQLKMAKNFHETWNHHSYSSYILFSKNSVSKHIPWQKILKGRFMDLCNLIGRIWT